MNTPIEKTSPLKKGLYGLSLLLGAIVIVRFSPLNQVFSLSNVINWVEFGQSHDWLPWIFYLGFILGVLALPVTLFPIIGGVLFHFWIAFPLNLLAITVGGWLAFSLSRVLGRDAVEPFIKGKLKSIDKMTEDQGFKTVFFLRWTGIPPFLVSNYALGLSRLKTKDFLLGTLIGIAPWTAFITYMSNSLWQAVLVGGEEGLKSALLQTFAPLTLFSLVVLASVITGTYLKRKKQPA